MNVLLLLSREGGGLAPLTDRTCAALLSVAAKPLAIHAVEWLAAAGLPTLRVAVSPHAEQVRATLGDGARWGVDIDYVFRAPGESAEALVRRCAPADGGELLVVHGEVLRSSVLSAFLAAAASRPEPHLTLRIGGVYAGVELIREVRTSKFLLPDDPANAAHWSSSGAAIDLDGRVSLVESLPALYRANLDAVAGHFDGVILPGLDRQPGLRVGRTSMVSPASVKGGRIFVGSRTQIHPQADLSGTVVIGDDVIVDRGATLSNTVVFPNTYVGERVDLTNAMVAGSTLIRPDLGSVTTLTDDFLLADTTRAPLSSVADAAINRAAGVCLVVLSAPLWPLALAAALLRRHGSAGRTVQLLGNRKSGDRRARPFTTFETGAASPLLQHLARVWAVAAGDIRLVGVVPLTADEAAGRTDEWEMVRDEAPVGLIGPAQLTPTCDSPEERSLLEAVYARTRSTRTDVMWVARGLARLLGCLGVGAAGRGSKRASPRRGNGGATAAGTLMKILAAFVRVLAFRYGRAVGMYRRLCRPDGMEWAAWLKARHVLFAMGERCSVQQNTVFTDPKYVRLGNNVRLSGCTLFGHDGSVNMLNAAYGCSLDAVGKIDVRDNVFIGHNAIVLPGVTIGPDAIVAAGAVVTRDVPPNSIAAGVPAKVVARLDEHVERLKAKTATLPWSDLLATRTSENYWAMQPQIDRRRLEAFFGPAVAQEAAPGR